MLYPHAHEPLTMFLDSWLSAHADTEVLPGFAITIHEQGRPLYSRAFGMANTEQTQKLSRDHLFNAGSQAKMFTAVLIMQLVQQNRLALHDPITRYLPWLLRHTDRRVHAITIAQLLWHGSGLIRDGHAADFWQLMHPFPSVSQLQNLILESKLVRSSGIKVKYSNLGYALLGQIIETVTGKPYREVAEDNIIRPLGLAHTHIYVTGTESVPNPIAQGHARPHQGQRPALPQLVPLHSFAAVCGWYSTVDDLATILHTLISEDDRLLRRQLKAQLLQGMRHHWQPTANRGTNYGLGFMHHDLNGHEIIGHGGAFIGYRSCTYADLNRRWTVSVMTNCQDGPTTEMAFGLIHVLRHFEQYATTPLPLKLRQLNLRLENILGAKQLIALPGKIVSVPLDDWTPFEATDELRPIDETTFTITSSFDMLPESETVQLDLDPTGSPRSVDYAGITMWPSGVYRERSRY